MSQSMHGIPDWDAEEWDLPVQMRKPEAEHKMAASDPPWWLQSTQQPSTSAQPGPHTGLDPEEHRESVASIRIPRDSYTPEPSVACSATADGKGVIAMASPSLYCGVAVEARGKETSQMTQSRAVAQLMQKLLEDARVLDELSNNVPKVRKPPPSAPTEAALLQKLMCEVKRTPGLCCDSMQLLRVGMRFRSRDDLDDAGAWVDECVSFGLLLPLQNSADDTWDPLLVPLALGCAGLPFQAELLCKLPVDTVTFPDQAVRLLAETHSSRWGCDVLLVRLNSTGEIDLDMMLTSALDVLGEQVDVSANQPHLLDPMESAALELRLLSKTLTPCCIHSAVAALRVRHPGFLWRQPIVPSEGLDMLAASAIEILAGVHQFVLPDAVHRGCMRDHARLATRLHLQTSGVLACPSTRRMVAQELMTRGRCLLDVWPKLWEGDMTVGAQHILSSGPSHRGRSCSYKSFHVCRRRFMYVDFEGVCLRFKVVVDHITHSRSFEEQEFLGMHQELQSMKLEEDCQWGPPQSLRWDHDRDAWISPSLQRKAASEVVQGTGAAPGMGALPGKVVRFLQGESVMSLIAIKNKKPLNPAKTYTSLQVKATGPRELLCGSGATQRRFRGDPMGFCIGFEWVSDTEHTHRSKDLNIGRGALRTALNQRPNGVIDKASFLSSCDLGALDAMAAWDAHTTPGASQIWLDELQGCWITLRYSEDDKMLCSGFDGRAVPNKIARWLMRGSLLSMVAPGPVPAGASPADSLEDEADAHVRRFGFDVVLQDSDGVGFQWCIRDKAWRRSAAASGVAATIGIAAPHAKILRQMQAVFAQEGQLMMQAFLSELTCSPWASTPPHIQGILQKHSVLYESLEASLQYSFRNRSLLLAAAMHPADMQVPLPSHRSLAVVGDKLLRFLVVRAALATCGFPVPELCGSAEAKVSVRGWRPGCDLRRFCASLDRLVSAACCKAAKSRACVRLNLHHLLLQSSVPGEASLVAELRTLGKKIDGLDWQSFVSADAPRCWGDTFEAAIAAILMDGTWSQTHIILHNLVVDHLLQPLPVDLLMSSGFASGMHGNGAPVASCVGVVSGMYEASEHDDLFYHHEGDSVAAGSCPLTAQLRASLQLCRGLRTAQHASALPSAGETSHAPSACLKDVQAIPSCATCGLQFNSYSQWRDHCNGARHKKKVACAQPVQAQSCSVEAGGMATSSHSHRATASGPVQARRHEMGEAPDEPKILARGGLWVSPGNSSAARSFAIPGARGALDGTQWAWEQQQRLQWAQWQQRHGVQNFQSFWPPMQHWPQGWNEDQPGSNGLAWQRDTKSSRR